MDLSNLYRELRERELLPIDLEGFRKWLEKEVGTPLEDRRVYTVPIPGAHGGFLKALRALGWRVQEGHAALGKEGYREKGVDVALAVDGVVAAGMGKNPLVLVSGDGDLVPMVKAARELGSRVVVVQFQSAIAWRLAAVADEVVLLDGVPWGELTYRRAVG